MRWVAKNIVAAGLADRVETQVAYAIGLAEPVGFSVETFGTGKMDDSDIEMAVASAFDLRPQAIIEMLDLLKPIYSQTSVGGHFGKAHLTWEQTNMIDDLKRAIR
jgi:S-adenosylmethionine synthetase